MRLFFCTLRACRVLSGHSSVYAGAPSLRSAASGPFAIRHSTFTRQMSCHSPTERPRQPPDDICFHAIEGVEYMGAYCTGGYHPVKIGDRFNDRYRVVHKLGHGTYSTVWMARDEQLGRLVALKVCIADANEREREILSRLGSSIVTSGKTAVDGRDLIPKLLDTFQVSGPHGTHTCLVTDIVRSTLRNASSGASGNQMQLPVARAMAAQAILAVAYLHQQGYVHGDLHTGNIFIQCADKLDPLSDEELYERFGEPEYVQVSTFDNKSIPEGVPTAAILPTGFLTRTSDLSLREARILLGDFGEAYSPLEEQRLYCNTPEHCRPPEDHFEPAQPRSFPSDVWTLATTIWGIMGIGPLFETMLSTVDQTVAMQIELLGSLPPEWWARWTARSTYFTEQGVMREDERLYRDWDDVFESRIHRGRRKRGTEVMSTGEKEALLAMLKSMLAYKPEDRCTMNSVLSSTWMREWAIPEYEKSCKQK